MLSVLWMRYFQTTRKQKPPFSIGLFIAIAIPALSVALLIWVYLAQTTQLFAYRVWYNSVAAFISIIVPYSLGEFSANYSTKYALCTVRFV